MEINHPETLAEVSRQFSRYQQAIIDNDIPVLNELFWDNPLTLRYGIGENLYGHAAIASYRDTRDVTSVARVVGKVVGIMSGAWLAQRMLRPVTQLPLRLTATAGAGCSLGRR